MVSAGAPPVAAALVTAAEQGPLDYGSRLWLKVLIGLVFVALYAPILALIAFSFNDSKRNVVWQGFTTEYYLVAWENQALIEAMVNSLTIALMSPRCSPPSSARGWRSCCGASASPSSRLYEGFMALPIVIPEICMGVALLVFFARMGRFMSGFESGPIAWWNSLFTVWPLNLASIAIAPYRLRLPLRRGGGPGAHGRVQPRARRGLARSRRFRMADLPERHPALYAAWADRRRASRLHPVARRFRHHLLHLGTGDGDLPGQGLFHGPPRVSPEVNAASTVLIVITLRCHVLAMRLQAPERNWTP